MSEKISEMTEATTLADADVFPLVQDSTGQNRKITKENLNTALIGYKKYVALLTQTGTNAPVATVLENTLGGTLVWTRNSQGIYWGTLAGVFPDANKITCSVGQGSVTNPQVGYDFNVTISNRVELGTLFFDGIGTAYADDSLTKTYIEIRVYP